MHVAVDKGSSLSAGVFSANDKAFDPIPGIASVSLRSEFQIRCRSAKGLAGRASVSFPHLRWVVCSSGDRRRTNNSRPE